MVYWESATLSRLRVTAVRVYNTWTNKGTKPDSVTGLYLPHGLRERHTSQELGERAHAREKHGLSEPHAGQGLGEGAHTSQGLGEGAHASQGLGERSNL